MEPFSCRPDVMNKVLTSPRLGEEVEAQQTAGIQDAYMVMGDVGPFNRGPGFTKTGVSFIFGLRPAHYSLTGTLCQNTC